MALAVSLTPSFKLVRAQTGAVTVDVTTNLTINAFALSELLDAGPAEEILIYWTADGATPSDTITFRPLHYDSANTRYVLGTSTGAKGPDTAIVVATRGTPSYILVAAKSATAATNLKIYASAILPAPAVGGGGDMVLRAMQASQLNPLSTQPLPSSVTPTICGHPIWTVFTITVPLTVNVCPGLTGTRCPIDTRTLDNRCPLTTMPGPRCGSDACCTLGPTTCSILVTRGDPQGC